MKPYRRPPFGDPTHPAEAGFFNGELDMRGIFAAALAAAGLVVRAPAAGAAEVGRLLVERSCFGLDTMAASALVHGASPSHHGIGWDGSLITLWRSEVGYFWLTVAPASASRPMLCILADGETRRPAAVPAPGAGE